MSNHSKLQIYQGIIEYLLDSTSYELEDIAALTNASIKSIRTLYEGQEVPANLSSSEKHLVQLYQMVLELELKQGSHLQYLIKEVRHENARYSASC